jgi:hypothetical protein
MRLENQDCADSGSIEMVLAQALSTRTPGQERSTKGDVQQVERIGFGLVQGRGER